jgi:hypothetical protein
LAVKTPAPERAAGRASLARRKLALPDGSFPVPNGRYWDKARQSVGRVADPAKRAAVAKLLRRTAPKFGKTAALKQSWAASSSHANHPVQIIDLVGPKGYVHGWIKVGGAEQKPPPGAPTSDNKTADQMTKAELLSHLAGDHSGMPAVGRRVGKQPKTKAELVAHHELMHHLLASGGRIGNRVAAFGAAHTHGMGRVGGTMPINVPGSMGLGALIPGKTGSLLSNPGIDLADGPQPYHKGADETVQCPACGKYNAPDARYCDQCGAELPDSAYASLSNPLEFAMPTHLPIRDPSDLVIVRGEGGHSAIIRHRAGGDEIGQIHRAGRGWRAQIGGRELAERTHQRTALADIIGTHNRGALTSAHRPASSDSAGPVLQPPAQQTPLMAQYGIPAVRTFATETTSSSSGGRMTSAAGDSDSSSGSDDSGPSGLTPKGVQIYKKLKAKGFPDARALAFAKRAQSFGGSK